MDICKKAFEQMNAKDIDHHASDLYLRKNSVSEKLVEEYEYKEQVKTFKDNIDHVLWYEISFAFNPFWEEASKGNDPYQKF